MMFIGAQILITAAAAALAYYLIRSGSSTSEFLGRRVGLWFGVIYGVSARIIFAAESSKIFHIPKWVGEAFSVMTFSFVVLVPVVIGIIDQVMVDEEKEPVRKWWSNLLIAFFHPMIAVLLMVLIVSAFALEGSICVVMALPILLGSGGAGGIVGLLIRKIRKKRASKKSILMTFVLLPYIASPIETRTAPDNALYTVSNTMVMSCSPEGIWNEVKTVPRIEDNEIPWTFAHLIGLPKPREALLSDERTGGIRVATFDGGLEFRETVTTWEPDRAIKFDIIALPAPPEVLDEHVTVGGPYFDVLRGGYEIQKQSDHEVLVTLSSTHRLSTTFNWYASIWTKIVMRDLQYAILTVVKARCEKKGSLS